MDIDGPVSPRQCEIRPAPPSCPIPTVRNPVYSSAVVVRGPYSVIDIPTKQPTSEPSSVPGLMPAFSSAFHATRIATRCCGCITVASRWVRPKKGGSNAVAPSKNPPASQTCRQPSASLDTDKRSSRFQPRSRGKGPISSLDSASADQRASGLSIPPGASTAIPEMTIGSAAAADPLSLTFFARIARSTPTAPRRRRCAGFQVKVPAVEHRDLGGVGVLTPSVEIAQRDIRVLITAHRVNRGRHLDVFGAVSRRRKRGSRL